MLVDAAAVFGEDGEVDGLGLRAFFQEGDFGFERVFGEVEEFVFGVLGEFLGGHGGVAAEVAGLRCQKRISYNRCCLKEKRMHVLT